MAFADELTSDQIVDLRDDIYWESLNVAYVPNTVIFQALTDQAIVSGVFAEFAYDTVTVGAYTDIRVGQTVFITTTTSLRNPIWAGRVRKTPTSSILYINETAIVLQTGWYVTVIDDYRLWEKLMYVAPDGTFYVDWDLAYAAPAPVIYNLQNAYINPAESGSASFSFAPLANAIADGASITTWLWEVADGTITDGSDSTQDITASFPQGFRHVRLTVTSSNGQTNFIVFRVWVGTTYIIPNIQAPQLSAELESGFNVTLQGYHTDQTTILRSLLDETFVCLYSTEYLSPTIVSNIDFVGRLANEDSTSRGDEVHSEIQEVSFEIQGVGAQLSALSAPQFRLEDSTSPSIWGQIVKPTPTRLIAHMATRLSTLSNICAVQFNSDNDVYIDKSLQNEETSAGAGMARMSDITINARLNHAPTGEIRIERDAFWLDSSAKSALTTVMNFDWDEGDLLEFAIKVVYKESVGEVVVAASRYNRATGKVDYFTSSAPPTAQGNGEFVKKQDGLLLQEGVSDSEAITDLNERAGALYALSQPLIKLRATFFDSWRNVLIPTCFQWYTFALPSASNTRGLVFTASQRWMLVSISRDIDIETGRNVTIGEFILEPDTGAAQILGSIIPDAVTPALPSIPAINAYAAFPPNPLINYPTDDPGDFDLQPIDYSSGYQMNSPLPQDAAQEAANNAGEPGCITYNVFFNNSSNLTGFTTQLGEDYTITVKGDAQISSDGWVQHINFGASLQGFTIVTPFGTQIPGQGIGTGDGVSGGIAGIRSAFVERVIASSALTSITATFDLVKGTFDAVTPVAIIFINGVIQASVNPADITDGNNKTLVWSGALSGVTDISVQIVCSYDNVLPYTFSGSALLKSLVITGTGTNPFTGTPGGIVRGDAFYQAYNPEAGGLATAYPSTQGLFINNAAEGIIPEFSTQHLYTFPFTGDGNPILLRFQDADYSDNQAVPMSVQVCGPGAGNYRR
jgi:hypothetical protein